MASLLDFNLGAPAQPTPPVAASGGSSLLSFDLGATPKVSAPTPAQQAQSIWNQTPAWQKPLLFVSQGINDVGTGIDRLLGIPTKPSLQLSNLITGQKPQDTGAPLVQAHRNRYEAPPDKYASPKVWNALDAQHPGFNYLVKWPTEFAASAPLGEGTGSLVEAGASKVLPKLPEGASLLTRALYKLPGSVARGAAYGVQQPTGNPGTNAAVGAVAGPVFEGGASLAGKVLGKTAEGATGLYRKFFPRELSQPELDSVLAKRFAEQGLPTSVTPRPTPPGVDLTTAVHSGDPRLLALQAAERISGNGTPFYEAAGANNAAIVNGLQRGMAPQADSSAISTTAHDLLQAAQKRGRAAVSAAYAPFDAVKGGVYLQREPIQNALREAYSGLLKAHQEMLPAKVREVMDATGPLHLTSDIEDLSARLNDAYRTAKPGTTAARAAVIMRDALNKGIDAAGVAADAERPALIYDPTRAPLPPRNTVQSDPREDSILQFLAKHPKGISSVEGEAQGLDPADMRSSAARVGIKRAFRQGGMSFDEAAQALQQAGYPVADEHWNYSPNVLLDQIDNELRGRPTYSLSNTRRAAELEREMPPDTSGASAPPDLTELASRAMQAAPEQAQAALDAWADDSPATVARVQRALQAAVDSPRQATADQAESAWKAAKAANKAFRDRFPQGAARDSEARQWLSRWLSGRKDSSRFLTEATVLPARAKAVLDSLSDSPAEREQMRRLMVNHYANRLLSATREGIPGTRTLNAEGLSRARANSSALERVLLNPGERDTLDRYVQAAHDNQKILQRLHSGSSETAALRNYAKQNETSVTEELLKHGASALHPAVGFLAHLLPALAKNPDNEAALQRTLTSALLNPDVYNRVAATAPPTQSTILRLLTGLAHPTQLAITRPAEFAMPRGYGPAPSGAR